MILSKLAADVARGVYASDAEWFQRELDNVISDAIRIAVQGAQAMQFSVSGQNDLRNKREAFHSAQCANGHVWNAVDVDCMDDDAFTRALCPFGGGLFPRCGATLTISYLKVKRGTSQRAHLASAAEPQ